MSEKDVVEKHEFYDTNNINNNNNNNNNCVMLHSAEKT